MAKKVRFPLEMDNGVEVRSLEELRENFSFSRILGYFYDGKLITWLQDRYASDIAEAIEQIEKDDEQLSRKICKIFEVTYDENFEDEIEKFEERKRKLELIKKYPECEEYVKKIDFIAFEQDDLYDLLDDDVDEIFLCGPKFSVPITKCNVRYIGIIDSVEIVIDSKKIIDFEEKQIVFDNCKFDAKYQEVIDSVNSGMEIETKNNIESDEKGDLSEEDTNEEIDIYEIREFVDGLKDILEEFLEEEFENEDVDFYEYDGSIECNASCYNDYGFDSKAKAKAACKDGLTSAIAEVRELYESEKKELIETTKEYYEPMIYRGEEYLSRDLYESYETLIDVYCTYPTDCYLEQKLEEFKRMVVSNNGSWESEFKEECEKSFKLIIKEHFEAEERDVENFKDLFNMCDFNKDGDEYSFIIDEACDCIADSYIFIIENEVDDFPNDVCDKYYEITSKYIMKIIDWLENLIK